MLKVNGDAYIDDSGVKISDLINRIKSLEKGRASISINPLGNISINVPSDWEHVRVPCAQIKEGKNTDVLNHNNDCVKVKKSGYYLVSATINVSSLYDISCIIQSDYLGEIRLCDAGTAHGMINACVPPTLVYLNAGDNVFLGFRAEKIGTYLCRGSRSILTVTEV